jgi:predicted TIM-barrel fold metal-dependent hydrolase
MPGWPGEGAASAAALHAIRPDWLGKHTEAPIDVTIPLVDAHLHLWDMPGNRYLLEDYQADVVGSGHQVVTSVYVQSGVVSRLTGPEELRSVGETEFAARMAAEYRAGRGGVSIGAIISTIDYSLGKGFERVMAAHEEAAGGLLRGFRGLTHWHADPEIHKVHTQPDILSSDAAMQAIASVSRRGLMLDVWPYHTQLPEVMSIAKAFPDLTIVVNHLGTPLACGRYAGNRQAVFDEWRTMMKRIAHYPRVFIKISGIGMRFHDLKFNHRETPPDSETIALSLEPFYSACIESFGYERCMFGSNFPVDKTSFSYGVLWNAFKRLCANASAHEKQQILAGTAARAYRLHSVGKAQ